MLEWVLDMVGWPVWAALALILVAVVWYRLGVSAGKIAAIAAAVLLAVRHIKSGAIKDAKAKQDAEDRKAISRANSDRLRARDDARRGKLHDDDGFKRP